MIIDSDNLAAYAAYDLLQGAAHGTVGIDQRWLHALIDDPEKTLPDIVRFGAEDRSDDPVPLEQDLISIFRYLKTPRGVPYLVELVRADASDITDDIVEALVEIGEPAIDPLLKLYEEIGAEHGGEIAFLLAGIGVRDPRILKLLLGRLDVSWNDALFHLEVYRDPGAIPELEKRASSLEGEQLLDLEDTIDDLRETRPETHVTQFDIWELYPEKADPDFDLASEEDRLEYLESPKAEHRAKAAASFFGGDFSIRARAQLLKLAQSDPEPAVRARAWEAFFDLTDDPELRRMMMARIADSETPKLERAGLAVALARHSDQTAVHGAIVRLAEDPETREKATEAMWRSFDPTFGRLAAGFLEDPNVEVRRNAIWGIGYLDVTAEAGALRKLFDDEELRPDALHNYALVAPGATTRKKIAALLEKIDELADGLTEGEAEAVKAGLDIRLARAGLDPLYSGDSAAEDESEPEPEIRKTEKVGRNDPCPCGSGKKYKKCHGQS